MPKIDLVCGECRCAYRVQTQSMLRDEDKSCPKCGSDSFRQTFASYRRNGPLLDPKWAHSGGDGCSHFG